MRRREFLFYSGATLAGLLAAMAGVPVGKSLGEGEGAQTKESSETLFSLPPRNDIILNGFYAIPESLVKHLANEPVIIPLHLDKLYPLFKGEKLTDPSALWYQRYLQGAIDAASRGQEVTMKLEMPAAADINVDSWGRYLYWLIGRLKATRMVIGNEMYFTKLTKNGKDWSRYRQYFAVAHDTIRRLKPRMEIALTAPEYYGHGEILDAQIVAIERENRQREAEGKEPITFDSIALHFYDEAHLLGRFLAEQKRVLARHKKTSRPIHLTELGVLEDEEKRARGFNNQLQAQQYLKLTATAAAFIDSGEIASACPYAAWDPGKPAHSLFWPKLSNQLSPQPAYFAYELARRLFHHEVTFEMNNNIVEIRGKTATNKRVRLAWNTGKEAKRFNAWGEERFRFTDQLAQTREIWPVLTSQDRLGRSGAVIIAFESATKPSWER